MLQRAAIAAGATIVGKVFHRFSPHGVSGVVVVQESHISIHTWPEEGYAAVDFYTCGECSPERAHDLLNEELAATSYELVTVSRGGHRMEITRRRSGENTLQSDESAEVFS